MQPVVRQAAPRPPPVCAGAASQVQPVARRAAPRPLPACACAAAQLQPVARQAAPRALPACAGAASQVQPVARRAAPRPPPACGDAAALLPIAYVYFITNRKPTNIQLSFCKHGFKNCPQTLPSSKASKRRGSKEANLASRKTDDTGSTANAIITIHAPRAAIDR